ncbi:trifunctional glycosyltransferase/class I SAM-dependent methyltransferase/polysaccharide deacetylase [Nostoc sp.]|uniref:trifunctional glycosyltransferase/class I SAM-dependent methyltransferase/polysaccharide deacetylase n=1 Tax=Nostoc sp. TaxID=1180 RepID=UPI002FFA7FE1
MNSLGVSVIIPAHNAAKTIAETLESVCEQTFSNWEVIIIDDGSSDETATIATNFAKQDSRMRVVSQPQMGVSAARNSGINLAQFDWLLFLDADDWILPLHLERLTTILASDPKLDAAYCSWMRVTSERKQYGPVFSISSDGLFPRLTQSSPMAIHTCIIRRSLVQAIGGFNQALSNCEDWDFWQRIARIGAYFSETSEVLAHYRIRTDSISTNALQSLIDGLQVITQGHAPDSRVLNPHPAYAKGQAMDDLPSAKLNWLCYCAGLAIGSGKDARPLLDWLQDVRNPDLLSSDIVSSLLYGLPLRTCPPLSEYHKFWQNLQEPINDFLIALENHLGATGLVRRARSHMERIILDEAVQLRPVTVGITYAVRVEVTEPIQDLYTPSSTERLHCTIELEGERLGILELPVFDGIVFGRVLADAIAAEFAWPILGRFFEHLVYPDFMIEQDSTGLAIQRGKMRLADGLPEGEQFWTQAHEQVGWTVFLQEIWGYPDWSQNVFYEQEAVQKETTKRLVVNNYLVVEVSDELVDLEVSSNFLNIVVTVGGVAIGAFIMPVQSSIVSAQKLRSKILLESGFELCRAAVREGLLGRSLTEKISLRDRLAEVVTKQKAQNTSEVEAYISNLVLGTAKALNQILSLRKNAMVIGCRTMEPIGSSASRWAMLPTTVIDELTDAALVTNELLIQISPQPNQNVERLFYTPDLILRQSTSQGWRSAIETTALNSSIKVKGANSGVRGIFETIFAMSPDPWDYKGSYEQTKYEQTLSLLPSGQIKQALELACAEGHFTVQLAPYVDNLVAVDISQIGLERAAKRCAQLKNVSYMHLDFVTDPLPSGFELIVCSEVFYYVGNRENLQAVAHKFVDALEPGGYLITAHANLVVDEPNRTGFNWDHPFGAKVIGEIIGSTPGLCLVKELHTPVYRVQLFQRKLPGSFLEESLIPEVIEVQHGQLNSTDAENVLWEGGIPQRNPEISIVTHTIELPILMYHRVASTGSSEMARWRVTPEAFEEQLRYLQDAGFYSVTLEDWRIAMMTKKPLPGRAVLITFDDGYLDFLTDAWPLLKRYGFSAMVFLVADRIGQTNKWDNAYYGENLPLLEWQQIVQLQAEGVEFASHSASHRHLSSLSPAEVVREGVRSRTILEQKLRTPIRAFSYPEGDVDPVVKHLIGACGYIFGLSCRSGRSSFQDPLLELPRIEIEGSDSLEDFVVKLSPLAF